MSEERKKCLFYEHGQQKKGWYMGIYPSVIYDEGNNPLPNTVAYVESVEVDDKGKIYAVPPQCITFLKDEKKDSE